MIATYLVRAVRSELAKLSWRNSLILMAGGVSSLCAEFKDNTVEAVYGIQTRRWILPIAKLIVFGAIAALTALLVTFLILWAFPQLFPEIWGKVEVFSGDGIQLLIGVPLYTLLITALGLGVAALVPKPGLVVMIVLLWKFGVEVFLTFVPGDLGVTLQQLSPFKNGELGVGQLATIKSMFGGQTGSLLYFTAICVAIFAVGTVRLARTDT
ncbi:MAG: ABC transporter permease [Nocardia sp.]|nr:ABC transporter permease [Nocardia sp.]